MYEFVEGTEDSGTPLLNFPDVNFTKKQLRAIIIFWGRGQCNGSILIFCDADDISIKHRLISLYNILCNALRPDLILISFQMSQISELTHSTINKFTMKYKYVERIVNYRKAVKSEYVLFCCFLAICGRRAKFFCFAVCHEIITCHRFSSSTIALTWCMSKKLWRFSRDRINGLSESFFYNALKIDADFIKVIFSSRLITFYEETSSTIDYFLQIEEFLLLIVIIRMCLFGCNGENDMEHTIEVEKFMVWLAGKVGKSFMNLYIYYKILKCRKDVKISLSNENRLKITAFCDIDGKKNSVGIMSILCQASREFYYSPSYLNEFSHVNRALCSLLWLYFPLFIINFQQNN
uniref:Uncharacterized protein n=1 Tax=Onchocerca volvulus TaxID=6282 RepID=A0A8R1Y2V0_ONCVO